MDELRAHKRSLAQHIKEELLPNRKIDGERRHIDRATRSKQITQLVVGASAETRAKVCALGLHVLDIGLVASDIQLLQGRLSRSGVVTRRGRGERNQRVRSLVLALKGTGARS